MPYSFDKAIEPMTGQLVFSGTTWKAAESPLANIAARVLRTPRGQCLAVPNFGVPFDPNAKRTQTTRAELRAAIVTAFETYTAGSDPWMANLRVAVQFQGGALVADVEFRDQRTIGAPIVRQTARF